MDLLYEKYNGFFPELEGSNMAVGGLEAPATWTNSTSPLNSVTSDSDLCSDISRRHGTALHIVRGLKFVPAPTGGSLNLVPHEQRWFRVKHSHGAREGLDAAASLRTLLIVSYKWRMRCREVLGWIYQSYSY